ncbi:MAG: hypothetical protein H7645_05290 [Candidatus Heimdallarchaeota archaeon]|nr:hypothetical protein [Candidatus Heimdallarchaeota archaeon]MCK4769736.1 hypothetical protein [Candidatus Heimdallarchaeota archaeon]
MVEDIITFKEEAVVVLDDPGLWDVISDPRYEPIFQALREGPMTVRVLTKKYNQLIYDFIEGLELSLKEKKQRKEELKRVEKTIYKYLNFLQKKKLIVKAGKRIQVDEKGRITQAASENLYGRTAKLFFFIGKDMDLKELPEFKQTVPIVGKILSLTNDLPEPSEKCLSKVLIKILAKLSNERKEIFEKYSEELAEVSKDASYDILKNVITILDVLYSILNASEYEEELKSCFKP